MSLIKNGVVYDDLNDIQLIGNDHNFFSLTYHSKGVKYFEFSNKIGSVFVIGYSSSSGEVTIDPIENYPNIYAYTTGNISLNGKQATSLYNEILDFQYSYNDHIGVGIDLDNHLIFYIHENVIQTFTFASKGKMWRIVVRQIKADNYEAVVSIYLNKKDFKYTPPFGALPWYSKIKLTCLQKRSFYQALSLHLICIIFT